MRIFGTALILAVAACSGAPRGPLHPAVHAGSAITDEQKESFFKTFDEASFRALAERAFRDGDVAADELLNRVVWNWYPGIPDEAGRRLRARQLLVTLAAHPDARVREGAWRVGRYLYQEPATSTAWASALGSALRDPDPDVRLAAIKTSTDLHTGCTGGCVVEAKKTAYSLRPQFGRLAERLFEEPDARVRLALLRALTWSGRRQALPAFVRYFTEADRRDEIPEIAWTVGSLMAKPEDGLESMHLYRQNDDALWTGLRAFGEGLGDTAAARRNGILLILFMAAEMSVSIGEDRPLLRRVIAWLEREEEYTREEDLVLILRHWRVMDPAKLNHRLHDFVRHSDVPEVLKGLKETLAALP